MTAVSQPAVAESVDHSAMLCVRGLAVEFASGDDWLRVVEDVSFEVRAGETLGLVGESGCGKTVSALSVLGLLPPRSGRIASGSITLDGQELTGLAPGALRRVRGKEIAMVFQEPMTSLNPAFTVGDQIAETIRAHDLGSRGESWRQAIELLDRVGIPDPSTRAKSYPHELSGGMRQRAMIAIALACRPRVLIADEPTTALDVTIQAQILELLSELQREMHMALVLVTHDLGIVAETCDRVSVMYAGQIVEEGTVDDVLGAPRHPYTTGLLRSMPQAAAVGQPLTTIPGTVPRAGAMPPGCRFEPRCPLAIDRCRDEAVALETDGGRAVRCVRAGETLVYPTPNPTLVDRSLASADRPLLQVSGLVKTFPLTSNFLRRVVGHVRAVDGIDFDVRAGETLGLVGESGSGKSTTARLLLRLIEPTAGSIVLDDVDFLALRGEELRRARRRIQMVFQDPYSSLDPRVTIGESVAEPLRTHTALGSADRRARVVELLRAVGLGPEHLSRYPSEFSGGQRQRIAVARALALEPSLLVYDEPLSSLDVSTQSQVLNLFAELQDRLGIASVFISHDLSVVRHVSQRIAVMYLGRLVEVGPSETVYRAPAHPYTAALLSAVPQPDPRLRHERQRVVLTGDVPNPLDPPTGCRFHPRCPYAMDICRDVDPASFVTSAGTRVACHLHTTGPTLGGASVRELERP